MDTHALVSSFVVGFIGSLVSPLTLLPLLPALVLVRGADRLRLAGLLIGGASGGIEAWGEAWPERVLASLGAASASLLLVEAWLALALPAIRAASALVRGVAVRLGLVSGPPGDEPPPSTGPDPH